MNTVGGNYIDLGELKQLEGLQIVHINVRSLLTKIDILRKYIGETNIDVLCITESWLHTSIPDNTVSLSNFQLYRNDRMYSRGGGKCIIYINKRFRYEIEVISCEQ